MNEAQVVGVSWDAVVTEAPALRFFLPLMEADVEEAPVNSLILLFTSELVVLASSAAALVSSASYRACSAASFSGSASAFAF